MPFKTKEQKAVYDTIRRLEIKQEGGDKYQKQLDTQRRNNKKSYSKRKEQGLRSACLVSRDKNPLQYALGDAKRRADKKRIPFDITLEDISIPTHCPILNIPLYRTRGKHTDNSPSLDRIDNTKGYVKGNVAVISYKANRYKSDLTLEVLDKLRNYMTQQ